MLVRNYYVRTNSESSVSNFIAIPSSCYARSMKKIGS